MTTSTNGNNNSLKCSSESTTAMQQRTPWIGGPGTLIPSPVESFLSWSLAISFLSISGYHYWKATWINPMLFKFQNSIRQWTQTRCVEAIHHDDNNNNNNKKKNNEPAEVVVFPCWLPLMTCSRGELVRATPMERYQQLVQLLESSMGISPEHPWSKDDEDWLVQHLRSHEQSRRLASLAMRPTIGEAKSIHTLALGQALIRVWPRLLELPHPQDVDKSRSFDIAIIMPAYGERGVDVRTKLDFALQGASHPQRIQVVIVDAGRCEDLTMATFRSNYNTSKVWGELMIVKFQNGGGRGPALNFGAQHATATFLTFCHSDTRLPIDWDGKVIQALQRRNITSPTQPQESVVANSCAFAFGIDTSPAGLNGGPYPPGIKAVETTANIRTHLYSLPYGDQCLSLPADIFHYLGGFPDQCLMEDYELIGLLRKRAALGPTFSTTAPREQLRIIDGPPALCSPRRWQKFGVLYVTFTNSKCVNLYAGGGSPEDIFHVYYGCPPPTRTSELSPWEVQLQQPKYRPSTLQAAAGN